MFKVLSPHRIADKEFQVSRNFRNEDAKVPHPTRRGLIGIAAGVIVLSAPAFAAPGPVKWRFFASDVLISSITFGQEIYHLAETVEAFFSLFNNRDHIQSDPIYSELLLHGSGVLNQEYQYIEMQPRSEVRIRHQSFVVRRRGTYRYTVRFGTNGRSKEFDVL